MPWPKTVRKYSACTYFVNWKANEIQYRSHRALDIVDQVIVVDDLHGSGKIVRPLRVHLLPRPQFVGDELLPVCGDDL